ncbi:hypothetical protein N037_14665 [Enterobacter sp. EGD-HP1]|nr:hypothetical protein N037_14665 [Enterobacter sp. EGD-HP1]
MYQAFRFNEMSLRVIATFALLATYFYQHNIHNFDK